MNQQGKMPAPSIERGDEADVDPGDLERARTYRLRNQIGTILRIANQNAIDVFNQAIADEFGEQLVTTTQFAVLSTLWRRDRLSHSELAARTVMDMPTLHSVLKRLERKGLVMTIPHSGDRRRRIVGLTGEGRSLALRLRSIGADISARILETLDDDQQETFLELLHAFNASRRDFPKD